MVACHRSTAVPPGASVRDDPNADTDLPQDTQFSVVARSYGADIVASVDQVHGGGSWDQALAYTGFTEGDRTVYLPNVTRRFYGYDVPFIIQNVGAAAATNVTVKYLDNVGNVLGTHTIASIAASAKANSTPVDATPTTPADAAKLLEFGTPKANANNAFGGSVILEAPGGQLIAIARVASKTTDGIQVAEDYNGIPVQ